MSPPKTRAEAARHVAQREKVTQRAIEIWQQMTSLYAKHACDRTIDPVTLEAHRFCTVAAFEGMLDAIKTESDALYMLDAIRNRANHRGPSGAPGRPARPIFPPRKPRDPA